MILPFAIVPQTMAKVASINPGNRKAQRELKTRPKSGVIYVAMLAINDIMAKSCTSC